MNHMPRWTLLASLTVLICCHGCGGDSPSPDARGVDASTIDGAVVDVRTVDVVDGPGIDGAIDAPVVDAAVIDVLVPPPDVAQPIDARPPDAAPPIDARPPPDAMPGPFVCDPVHQTGCAAGQKCDLGASGTFECVPDGTLADFRLCDPVRPNACVAGTTCRNTNFAGENRCAPLCDPGEDTCRVGEPCNSVRTTSDGHQYRMCANNNQCNPVLDDCKDTSKACGWSAFGAFCVVPGSIPDGGSCTTITSCKRGSTCLAVPGAGNKCFKVCNPAGGAPACGAGVTCSAFSTIGPQAIGACGYNP